MVKNKRNLLKHIYIGTNTTTKLPQVAKTKHILNFNFYNTEKGRSFKYDMVVTYKIEMSSKNSRK